MIIKRNKTFSSKRDDREIVPAELVKKAETEGVIQEYNGKWRIISLKANPPRFWNSHYSSKEKATKALDAYHANKK